MAGITNGTPEVAVGEPVKLGDNGEYELEHEPITDRLVVRDTVNNEEAYIRPETTDQIGDRGALLRSLINSEPLADDGRLYGSIQDAERAANGWVFVPPGTFTEDPTVTTDGLTLVGTGYGSYIDGGSSHALVVTADNVTVDSLRIETTGTGDGSHCIADTQHDEGGVVKNCWFTDSESAGVKVNGDGGSGYKILNNRFDGLVGDPVHSVTSNTLVAGNVMTNSNYGTKIGSQGGGDDSIVANNIYANNRLSIQFAGSNDCIAIGNICYNSTDLENIVIDSPATDCIVANNRISDSAGAAIDDTGTNTLFDANLTGASN